MADIDYKALVVTDGPDQNSYITIDEANLLFLTLAPSFLGDDTAQLNDTDVRFLIEAGRDLDALWSFKGQPTSNAQNMAWPRIYVEKPGFEVPAEPMDGDAFLQFKIDYLTAGRTIIPYLDHLTVPRPIKEAQALLALLRKLGKNPVGDNQGDAKGLQLDSGFKVDYVNALRDSADIHRLLSGLGVFIGDRLLRSRNG
ncbi:DnaT-like ssDNA-binding protein [Sphingomonas sp. Leaf28]|uniref:DnaT-like ssDNA-binding protein n=1 Tax=Sphingomonas sp. Leaf28 TaxID=1735695 RepID=UPI0006F886AD|nr:DnaT-like ssDNA-binding protein [Sphingomonas sp. Leaf28]KQN09077.1 hypothetical protein ASE79_14590 [Sphingomonas sp. Leaf28]